VFLFINRIVTKTPAQAELGRGTLWIQNAIPTSCISSILNAPKPASRAGISWVLCSKVTQRLYPESVFIRVLQIHRFSEFRSLS
jgi:hypothetical protein